MVKHSKHPRKSKKTKQRAYGEVRKKVWCDKCDAELVSPPVSKKRERKKVKDSLLEDLKRSRPYPKVF